MKEVCLFSFSRLVIFFSSHSLQPPSSSLLYYFPLFSSPFFPLSRPHKLNSAKSGSIFHPLIFLPRHFTILSLFITFFPLWLYLHFSPCLRQSLRGVAIRTPTWNSAGSGSHPGGRRVYPLFLWGFLHLPCDACNGFVSATSLRAKVDEDEHCVPCALQVKAPNLFASNGANNRCVICTQQRSSRTAPCSSRLHTSFFCHLSLYVNMNNLLRCCFSS